MFLRNFFKKKSTLEYKPYPKLITHQPSATVGVVASFLALEELKNLSKACTSRALFSKTLAVKTLLQTVVYGDLKQAEAIIIRHPQLLLERGTVKDYSGRVHSNRTALQLAIGACDYNVKSTKGNIVVDGMVEMIEKHFNQLPGKKPEEIKDIMRSQYEGQFPEGYEETEAERAINDSAALHRIFNVIADLKNEKDCVVVSALEDQIHNIIRKGKPKQAEELNNLVQSMLKATSHACFENAFQDFTSYVIKHKLIKDDAFNFDLLKLDVLVFLSSPYGINPFFAKTPYPHAANV